MKIMIIWTLFSKFTSALQTSASITYAYVILPSHAIINVKINDQLIVSGLIDTDNERNFFSYKVIDFQGISIVSWIAKVATVSTTLFTGTKVNKGDCFMSLSVMIVLNFGYISYHMSNFI